MNLCRRLSRHLLTGAVAAGLACAPLAGQEGCAVSKDLVVRALELVSATPARDDLSNGILLLKQAEEACDENGDAWYYRSLFERKLGRGNPQYSLGKARERNSAALKSEDDPFYLATPATRGVHIAPQGARPEARPAGPAQKWALVVGIATFSDARLNLKFTDKDATSMAALLKDPVYGKFRARSREADCGCGGDHGQCTRGVKLAGAASCGKRSGGDLHRDARHVARPGHGRRELHGDLRHGREIAGRTLFDGHSAGGDFKHGADSAAALKAVVILDTCHSQGALSQTVTVPASISPQMVDHIREGTGRVMMGASQAEESSYESPKYGHGLFTYYLLQGMKERKDAPIDKIFEYVKAHVEQDAAANGWKQHPFFSASDAAAPLVLGF